ncbi:MAG: kinase/pyrophosphorylase [Deltaproteobacteria bacterium]|nr:kinase/pyrophosphorylase [Deltaproteobacteria bacterium]MBW2496081.1 kinase/pyrophosphorylase [Deltaproteobacteria bacterium]
MSEPSPHAMAVYVVSDGTGDTGSAAVRAAMVQFREPWRLRVFRDTRTIADVRDVMAQAQESGAVVVFSLVEGEIVEALIREAEHRGVAAVDLLGPLIMKVAQRLHVEPRHQPGLLHGFSDEYFQRVEAVEFAVRHDDGANLHTLHEADIVLTGVSRTSKTPLSMYLAQRGFKTGNVPLIPGLDPPSQLLELNPRRVFGLTVDPGTLLSVRTARLRTMKAPTSTSYTDPDQVMLELDRARRLFRAQGWRMVDVSGRAVEENASRIIEAFDFAVEEHSG